VKPPHHVLLRDLHVAEDETSRASAATAHEAVEVLRLHAGSPLDEQAGDRVPGLRAGIGAGVDKKEVRPFGPHDEALLAVEQKVVAPVLRSRRGAEEIGAPPWFRKALGGKALAPQQGLHEPLLLLVRAVQDDRVADEFRPHAEYAGHLVAQGSNLLHDHACRDPVHPPAAPLLRVAAAQKVTPPGLLQELLREPDRIGVHVEDHLPGDPLHEIPRLLHDLSL